MRLTDLTDLYQGDDNPEIKGISSDSRKVREGHLFVALSGVRDNGARYIADAIRHGAVAVLCQNGTSFPPEQDITAVKVFAENPRRELAHIAAKFYGQQPETLAVVTGTNGKTSTAHFTQQLWEAMGFKAASMGTLGVHGGGIHREGTLTTPDTIALHAELADLAAAGITHLAMEGSSHGLHQSRLDGVHATVAGFTNLSRDHLDYHKTMDDYLIAKAHLFSEILNADGVAMLNADIPEFEELNRRCGERGCKVISYGYQGR
ncbi:MAG: Mur ligase family protein, partial [Pseudomonadota bacterium]|nr:Mur ligase family protein [Pseudomonadota bacterium]